MKVERTFIGFLSILVIGILLSMGLMEQENMLDEEFSTPYQNTVPNKVDDQVGTNPIALYRNVSELVAFCGHLQKAIRLAADEINKAELPRATVSNTGSKDTTIDIPKDCPDGKCPYTVPIVQSDKEWWELGDILLVFHSDPDDPLLYKAKEYESNNGYKAYSVGIDRTDLLNKFHVSRSDIPLIVLLKDGVEIDRSKGF